VKSITGPKPMPDEAVLEKDEARENEVPRNTLVDGGSETLGTCAEVDLQATINNTITIETTHE